MDDFKTYDNDYTRWSNRKIKLKSQWEILGELVGAIFFFTLLIGFSFIIGVL